MTSFIQVDGQRLGFEVSGAGEPVLLLHSGGFSSRQWKRLAEALATSHQVVNPDLLGYGASEPWPLPKPFHFEQDLAAVTALVSTVTGGKGVHLVGHSYGGFLALKFAAAAPSQVKSLALYEPVAFGVLEGDPALDELRTVRLEYHPDPITGADEPWLQAFVEWWNGPHAWHALNAATRAAFLKVGWKVFEEVRTLSQDRTPAAAYALVEAPALLLGGQLSPHVEQKVLERLAQALPQATTSVLEGVGHMGPITHAPLVNAAILQHLRKTAASA